MKRIWIYLAVIVLSLALVVIIAIFKRCAASTPGAPPPTVVENEAPVETEVPIPPSPESLAELNAIRQLNPITLSVANQPVGKAIEMVAATLGAHQPFDLEGNSTRLVSLDVTEQPFWEVVRAIQDQVPCGFYDFRPGVILDPQIAPVLRFEIQNPAILYAQSIAYERTEKLLPDSALHAKTQYLLTLGAVVDPRLTLAKNVPVKVTRATDDQGRSITGISVAKSNVVEGVDLLPRNNFWLTTVALPELKPATAWISVTCEVRFAVLRLKEDFVMNDPTQYLGKEFTVGGRTLVLAQLRPDPFSGTILVNSKDGLPITDIVCAVNDSKGKSVPWPVRNGEHWALQKDSNVPFQLAFSIATVGPDVAIPIELKQIPLP